jgi:hypothetical protein
MTWQVPIVQNLDLMRRQINEIFGEIEAAEPGSGGTLPGTATPEGRLFVLTTTGQMYQARSGVWEPITGSWGA